MFKTEFFFGTLFLIFGVLVISINANAQKINVHGKVIEAKHQTPLAGVNIRVQGTTTGVSTDSVGHYKLTAPSPTDTLIFSFIGYNKKKISIKERSEINITLKQVTMSGENLIVTAFGEQRNKVSVVGAVQTVKSPSKTLKVPSSSLTNAFAGRMAGVTAFQRSGQPGANASRFYIRGISTFSGATQPLIIIDGVQSTEADLNALSPEVIKSFSILKDATATAVYGSRGANGVMIVETKTGSNLAEPKINVRLENSISKPTQVPDFVGGVRFMELYNEATRERSTGENPYSQEKINRTRTGENPYIYPNVNWYDKLFKSQAINQRLNINIRGGGRKVDYFMSATFNRDNGILKSNNLNSYNNNISFKRYSFQNNLDIQVTPTTKISLKLNTILRNNHGPAKSVPSIFSGVMKSNPVDFPVIFPKTKTSDNNKPIYYGGKRGGTQNNSYINPFAEMVNGYSDSFNSRLKANIHLNQNLDFITKGLSFKGLASFDNNAFTQLSRIKNYEQFQAGNIQKKTDGSYTYDLKRIGQQENLALQTHTNKTGNRRLYLEARLNYNRQVTDKQEISALLLYNQTNFTNNSPASFLQSLPKRSLGFAGRLSYSYKNTYLAEFNFGYNGTENFASGHRFGFFPSLAIGYVISNQDFWKSLKPTINLFKLRASWGKVGNDQIGSQRFAYQPNINLNGIGYYTGRSESNFEAGPVAQRVGNKDLTWELAKKYNLGLDLEIAHKLNINLNVFKENRSNIFLKRNTIPPSFGVSGTSFYGNFGEVVNHGFEANLNYSKSLSDNLYMALKGTFTYARNKVTAMDEPPNLNANLSSLGHPINSHLIFVSENLFKNEAEINNSANQQLGGFVMPGDIKYQDITGDGKITNNDKVRMGYPAVPEIEYGIGPSFKFKNFDFSFLLEGVARTSFVMDNFRPFGKSGKHRNVLTFIANDHWSTQNPDIHAEFPRLSVAKNENNIVPSTYWLRNGSYIQLKNLELGYTFKNTRVYISGHNLFMLSKFKLWNPEQGPAGGNNGLSYPIQRIFNIGIHLNL